MTEERVTLNPCQGWGCHEHCIIETHTRDGKIVRTQKKKMPGTGVGNEICMKGILSAKIPYVEDRILYPLKRVGKRGEGKFERISWDQAFDEIAAAIKKATDEYGPRSIILNQFWCGHPGDWHSTQNSLIYRFAHAWDATILEYQAVDYGLSFAPTVDFGFMMATGRYPLRNHPNMVLIWGGNPLGYTRPAASTRLLLDAQEEGAKLVHISNLFDVTSAKADQWVLVKSGTDAALALAMAHVIIRDGLTDVPFMLGKTAAAYLVRTDTGKYLRASDIEPDGSPTEFYFVDGSGKALKVAHPMGQPFPGFGEITPQLEAEIEVNGIPCKTAFLLLKEHLAAWTPEHQEEVTGVPADVCVRLAHEYATADPATIFVYYGLRYANATQTCRAIQLISYLSGNFGVPGGSLIMSGNSDNLLMQMDDTAVQYPPEQAGPGVRTPVMDILESFEDPSKQQYKVWLNCMGNPLLNWPNKKLWREEILPNIDLFVSWEIRMTDTARYADIILPEATCFERTELLCGADDCVTLCEAAIDPLGEAKTSADIWRGIAERVGGNLESAFNMSLDEFVALRANTGLKNIMGPVCDDAGNQVDAEPITYDRLKKEKVVPLALGPMADFDVLSGDAWMTDTGRLEFYNEVLNDIGAGFADFETTFMLDEEKRKQYPLQFYPARHKYFMQGQFTNVPESCMLASSQFGAALNPAEAEARGLHDGDEVEVFNERGVMRVKLQLRDDLPMGMVHTWYSFDETWYPNNCCPQDIAMAENTPDTQTEFMKLWGPLYNERAQTALHTPQVMTHVTGLTTPEVLWDTLCDIRKAGE